MKTLKLIIAGLLLIAGAYAQSGNAGAALAENSPVNNMEVNSSVGFNNPDAIWMKNGKVILLKEDMVYFLESDITLRNGTIVLNNGTIGNTDGTVAILKEGEHIDFSATENKK